MLRLFFVYGFRFSRRSPAWSSRFIALAAGLIWLTAGAGTPLLNAALNASAQALPPGPGRFAVKVTAGSGEFGGLATFGVGTNAVSVAVADLNGDGVSDLAVANYGVGTVSVLLGTGGGSFSAKTDVATGTGSISVAIADLNGDGKPDLAVPNNTGVSVLLGSGDGSFGPRTNYAIGDASSIVIGDVNGDGKPDLTMVHFGANTVAVMLGAGDGSFGPARNFPVGRGPAALAIGDVNLDGQPDLISVNFNASTVSVLLGTGGGSFAAKTDFPVGSGAIAVALGDVNRDGTPDVAVANYYDNTVSVLLGTGTGSLAEKTDLPTGSGPMSVALEDVNGDGILDLASANFQASTVSILPGTGSGGFAPKMDVAVGALPNDVILADVNGDGAADLVTANFGDATVSVRPGLGGSVTPVDAAPLSAGDSRTYTITPQTGFAIADVRVDGTSQGAVPSVMLANVTTPHTISAAFQRESPPVLVVEQPAGTAIGAGATVTFAAADAGAGSSSLTFAIRNSGVQDLTGLGITIDGADAAMFTVTSSPNATVGAENGATTFTVRFTPSDPGLRTATLHLASNDAASPFDLVLNGSGAIAAAPILVVEDPAGTPVALGEGQSVGATNVGTTLSLALTLSNTGTATLTSSGVALDGPDAAMFSVTTNPVMPVPPGGKTTLTVQFAPTAPGARTATLHIASNDTPRSPFTIPLSGLSSGSVLLPIQATAGSGEFGSATTIELTSAPESVAVTDVNGDGIPDLVVGSQTSNTVTVLRGTGSGSFAAPVNFPTVSPPTAVAIGDVNGDGKADIVVLEQQANVVSVLLNTGVGEFGAPANFATGSFPLAVAIGDVNGDGNADLVVSTLEPPAVSVRLGQGDGDFGPATLFPTGLNPTAVVIADVSGDGKPDLVVVNSNTVSVLVGSGDGRFGAKTDFPAGLCAMQVAVGDVNADGKPDLAVVNRCAATVSVLLGTGGGSFAAKTDFAVGAAPASVTMGDLNGDGLLDLAVTNLQDDTVSVLLGIGDGTFGGRTDFPTGVQPNWVVLADVTGDGGLDLVVANRGDNTVSVLPGLGGTITPAGVTLVTTEESQSYTIAPQAGFAIEDVRLDGASQGPVTSATFTNVTAPHTISAAFQPMQPPRLVVELPTGTAIGTGAGVSFAPVAIGGSSGLTFTIRNVGRRDLTGLGITIDGADPGMFAVTALPSALVSGPNGTTTFTVRFSPTGVGQRTAALHLASNDLTANPFDLALSGIVLAPHLVVEQPLGTPLTSDGTVAFGGALVGVAKSLTFTIRNTGSADLNGLGITIDGADRTMFAVTAAPSAPVSGPNGTTTFTVRFAPDGPGLRTATLHLGSSDPTADPFNLALTGTGSAPHLIVEQPLGMSLAANATVPFGSANVGSAKSLTFLIRNTGNADLTGLGITIDGADGAMFTVTSSPSASITGPNGATTFVVRFAPSAVGLRSAALHVASSDPTANPLNLTLTGAGTAPHIIVEQPPGTPLTSGGTVTFGGVSVGSAGNLTFTVRNTGNADLTGLGITIDGADAATFTVTSFPSASVSGPTGTTTFTVRFAPGAQGLRSAALHLSSNDPAANPFNLGLTGTGTSALSPIIVVEQPAGTALASGASRSFGTTNVGTNLSLQFTIRNTGTATLTGISVTIDGTDAAMFSITTSPTTPLGVGGSTTMGVRFAPTAAGTKTSTLHIASSDAARSPFNIGLSGVGAALPTFTVKATAGSGDFGTPTAFAVGNAPHLVAVGDLNGDGIPDSVTANQGSNTMSVLLGQGNGIFGATQDFATGRSPYAVAIGDVNGDGKPDVVVGNFADNTVSVFLNTGAGGFGAKTDYATGGNPFAVSIGDLSGDGKPDLAVAAFGPNGVSVLTGTGTGSFGASTDWATGNVPTSVATADLNGDGRLDLVVANYISNTVSVLLGTGGGSFAAKTDFATGTCPFKVAVGDVNGDGKPDLAVANNCAGTVSILLGTGSGSFAAKADFLTGLGPSSVAIADVNADGTPDLVVANFQENTVSVLLGAGNGSFGAATNLATGIEPEQVAVTDVNADGLADLVVAGVGDNTVLVQLGAGGTIVPGGVTQVTSGTNRSYAIVPQAGYAIANVRVDGGSLGAVTSWTFVNVTAPHTISATFRRLLPPQLVVEQPAGTALVTGGTKAFGSVVVGGSTSLTFTVRNTGERDLTGLAVTIDGADAALFTVTAAPAALVKGPTGTTTFTVRFVPGALGARTAALHVTSTDPTTNPVNLTLTGTGN